MLGDNKMGDDDALCLRKSKKMGDNDAISR